MNSVSFPGLGLAFSLEPVAFRIFGFEVFWYGIIIAAGFTIAVIFCLHIADRFGLCNDDVLDMLLFATPGAIIGARLYYILFYLDNFKKPDGSLDFMQMPQIHDGGIAIYGAIIGGVVVAVLVMRHKKIPFLAMGDVGAFGLLIGQLVGRWGNFVNAEAFGGETSLPWRMGVMQAGGYTEVHPTFLYESLWNLFGFIILFVLLKCGLRKFDGFLFFTYIAWYGIGRGIIEGLRTDSLYLFDTGIRVSQMLGYLSAAAALAYILYRLHKKPQLAALYVNKRNEKGEDAQDGSNDS